MMTYCAYGPTRNNMTILGIDPGTTRMGYAVVKGTAQTPELVTSGVIGDARLLPSDRLHLIHRELLGLIRLYKPDRMAIEKLFFSKNVKTALSVAEARGVILLTAKIADRTVYEYTPQEVKISLTSQGNADKQQVAAMARALVPHVG